MNALLIRSASSLGRFRPRKTSSATSSVSALNCSNSLTEPTGNSPDALGDHGLHLLHVALERGGAERLLQDVPVVTVLVEVEEHDAAVEEGTDEVAPRRTIGERPVLVHQDLLRGAGGVSRHHHPHAEGIESRHVAEPGAAAVGEGERVAPHRHDLEDAVTTRTRHGLQAAPPREGREYRRHDRLPSSRVVQNVIHIAY